MFWSTNERAESLRWADKYPTVVAAVAGYLHYEVDQSQQDPQGQACVAVHLLVGDQVAEPQRHRGQGLVNLA